MTIKHLLVASGLAALLLVPLAAISFAGDPLFDTNSSGSVVETVDLPAGSIEYPKPGEFLVEGRPVPALIEKAAMPRTIAIMKHQVSLADYQHCVAAGACKAADAVIRDGAENLPVTGVSYLDAEAFAAWYSNQTGERWRLPTDAEWAYAAAERFTGESYSAVASDPENPAVAWIRRYQEEAAARREPDPNARPFGHFGANTKGIEDLAGNVWEWTSTCYSRTTLDARNGHVLHITVNCGVHVAEGRHRAYMSNFIRDGASGGCAVGTPPEHLGFRLVRDEKPSLPERLLDALRGAIGRGPVS
jgi:formylglycine-generating enzyme required for sulfatase activity